MRKQITTGSEQEFKVLKNRIHANIKTFAKSWFDVGNDLREIRDNEHFRRDGFDDFQSFAKAEFNIGKSHANRLIDAAIFRQKLPSPQMGEEVWTEAAVRPLTRLPKLLIQYYLDPGDHQTKREVLELAENIGKDLIEEVEMDGGKITAAKVEKHIYDVIRIDCGEPLRRMREKQRKYDERRRKWEEEDRKREEKERKCEEKQIKDLSIRVRDLSDTLREHLEFFASIPEDIWLKLAENYVDDMDKEETTKVWAAKFFQGGRRDDDLIWWVMWCKQVSRDSILEVAYSIMNEDRTPEAAELLEEFREKYRGTRWNSHTDIQNVHNMLHDLLEQTKKPFSPKVEEDSIFMEYDLYPDELIVAFKEQLPDDRRAEAFAQYCVGNSFHEVCEVWSVPRHEGIAMLRRRAFKESLDGQRDYTDEQIESLIEKHKPSGEAMREFDESAKIEDLFEYQKSFASYVDNWRDRGYPNETLEVLARAEWAADQIV